jgi:hypothetical protein
MRDEEYEKAKAEATRKDIKRSMIMFPLLFLVIFSGLIYILMNR